MESLLLMVAMIAVFYFLIIRPENKRKKQAEQMRSSLKKGDRVTTIGGRSTTLPSSLRRARTASASR